MVVEADEGAQRGSTNEETRQRNLALVLANVHRSGGLSRAELTRISGLNRSTVGALVAELVERGLVVEGTPVATKTAGRPSPIVQPSPHVAALVMNPDVGGVILTLVGLGGVVMAREAIQTDAPPSPEQAAEFAVEFLTDIAPDLPKALGLVGVAVAVPGLVDERRRAVVMAPHLGWADLPVADVVGARLGLPVVVANDADAGVLAERVFGAGVGLANVVYLNGSESCLGSGVVSGGTRLRGANGHGAELGHMLLEREGEDCRCGRRGCLETLVNVRRVWDVLGVDRTSLDELDSIYASAEGHLAAELDAQADALADGISSIVVALAPERVILGGHVGALLDVRGERIRARVRKQAYGQAVAAVSIVRNHLRERMVPIGAAERAFAQLLRDPVGTRIEPAHLAYERR